MTDEVAMARETVDGLRTAEAPMVIVDGRAFRAVLFDMDGVVTDTATHHEDAWARMFDEFLAHHDREQRPFSHDDYHRYVDGRARVDGVAGFLESRKIDLPRGSPTDSPAAETVFGLAARKDGLFSATLASAEIEVIPATVDLIGRLRTGGVPTAVVSASRHAEQILTRVGLLGAFDARVDGVDGQRLRLPGKPDPALFLEAARRLGVTPGAAVVVEDAVAGVQAARSGGFGLVVGLDRHHDPAPLSAAGADRVVAGLDELDVAFAQRD